MSNNNETVRERTRISRVVIGVLILIVGYAAIQNHRAHANIQSRTQSSFLSYFFVDKYLD